MLVFSQFLRFNSTKAKVVATFLIASASVFLSWQVSRSVFEKILESFAEISAPDRKLALINDIFQDVIKLNQLQREELFSLKHSSEERLLQESQLLEASLDSLELAVHDSTQSKRINTMKGLLRARNKLFARYQKLRTEILDSKVVADQAQLLSNMIETNLLTGDTTLLTGETKITTTFLPIEDSTISKREESESKSWLKKLFTKKKAAKESEFRKVVKQEIQVKTDTLTVSQKDSLVAVMKVFVDSMRNGQMRRNKRLVNEEIEFARAGNKIMDELFGLLHQVQDEELQTLKQNGSMASFVVSTGLDRLKIILIVFGVATGLLVMLIFFDITQNIRYRKQLQASKDEAEHLGQVKQRFLANMSHELRTPLQSIIGFSEQVRLQEEPDKQMIDAIYQSSGHLLQIVNETLDYSRIVSGKFTFDSRTFNMADLLAEVSATIKMQAARKSVSFIFRSTVNPKKFFVGDPFRLRQILYNILGNAAKFTDQGEISFDVRHLEQGDKTEFLFVVVDSGSGISQEDRSRIFGAFEQASEGISERFKGTGLGLSIAKELIEHQNGEIVVDSTPGVGSRFAVRLSFEGTMPPAYDKRPESKPIHFDGKVIVVEDDPYIAQLCSSILGKYAIQNAICSSAENFQQMEWLEDIRLVLIDIRLPGMSGLDLCRTLRKKVGNKIRISALTAQTMMAEHTEIMESGFDSIVVKPFRENDLLDELRVTSSIFGSESVEYDLSSILKMAHGDHELYRSNLTTLIEASVSDLTKLKNCLLTLDRSRATNLLHRLAGRIGQAGAKNIFYELSSIESHLRTGGELQDQSTAIEQCIGRVMILLDHIMREVTDSRAI